MKVYMLKDVEKVGFTGEIISVPDGFARNYLIPNKLGKEILPSQEAEYKKKAVVVQNRKEMVATKTSMLAEKIANITLAIKKKMHDDDRLYGSISPSEVVDLLKESGISVSKSQVVFDKKITAKGTYPITIKLSSTLQPTLSLKVLPE